MDHHFRVHLGGIINLLSNNLYSGPQVFVRELLQNAVDAIRAREQIEQNWRDGRVQIEIVEDSGAATLICQDNGIGLTEAEVHRFLATIGESSKRGDLGEARSEFIGQFGIGLLSCFMVADEIVVITRSARPASAAVEWRGRPDGTYGLRTVEGQFQCGTRVYLRCKSVHKKLFEPEQVRELAMKYGSLLPYPVTITAGRSAKKINDQPPWERRYESAAAKREALMVYGQRVFGANFFDYIPLSSRTGDVQGVAFVLPFSPSPTAKSKHRVYLKRMLLSEAGEGVLPDWAFFVRCVINANDLRPLASREGFYEDQALERTREALGKQLRQYILELADTNPDRLKKLIALHYLAIKALAVYDEEFYRIFIDYIPFETSLGAMSMGELRRRSPHVQYAPTVDEFRQIARVAAAQDLCVVNAGYTYNEELLLRLGEVFDDVHVEPINAAGLAESFAELSDAEREEAEEMMKSAAAALRPFRCGVELRRFEPEELPALFTTDPDGLLRRQADQARDIGTTELTSAIDSVLGPSRSKAQAVLLLNYNNPIIRRLAPLKRGTIIKQCIEMLYVQSLLLGHHPLSSRELSLLNSGLSSLIEVAVQSAEKEET